MTSLPIYEDDPTFPFVFGFGDRVAPLNTSEALLLTLNPNEGHVTYKLVTPGAIVSRRILERKAYYLITVGEVGGWACEDQLQVDTPSLLTLCEV